MYKLKFEIVKRECFEKDSARCGFTQWDEAYDKIELPKRQTEHSAGYDFSTPYKITLWPNERVKIPTGIKAKMDKGEFLMMAIRSSIGINKKVLLSNGIAIIDGDYYGNEDNDGDIHLALWNTTGRAISFEAGTRLVQGLFVKFGVTEDDDASGERTGGMGSTGRE